MSRNMQLHSTKTFNFKILHKRQEIILMTCLNKMSKSIFTIKKAVKCIST